MTQATPWMQYSRVSLVRVHGLLHMIARNVSPLDGEPTMLAALSLHTALRSCSLTRSTALRGMRHVDVRCSHSKRHSAHNGTQSMGGCGCTIIDRRGLQGKRTSLHVRGRGVYKQLQN